MCGIGQMIGVPLTEEMQENLPAADPALGYEALEPEARRLVRNLSELGDARVDDPASWDLRLTEAERAKADEALAPAGGRPLIALCIGTKVPANDWGRENWRELAGRLAGAYPGHALVVTGAVVDREPSEFVVAGWRQRADAGLCGPVLNLCG